MDKQEMRFLRRELINDCLHAGIKRLSSIKIITRATEYIQWGMELKAYA